MTVSFNSYLVIVWLFGIIMHFIGRLLYLLVVICLIKPRSIDNCCLKSEFSWIFSRSIVNRFCIPFFVANFFSELGSWFMLSHSFENLSCFCCKIFSRYDILTANEWSEEGVIDVFHYCGIVRCFEIVRCKVCYEY